MLEALDFAGHDRVTDPVTWADVAGDAGGSVVALRQG
jgi:hypothetical protein